MNEAEADELLTIFATPKPFRGHAGLIQENAVRSWLALRPRCEVILFGNDGGTAQAAAGLGVRHIAGVECSPQGTPLVSSMFHIAQGIASHQLMCYLNADMIMMGDFLPAVGRVTFNRFLLIGQRWDLDFAEPLDFSAGWEEALRARLKAKGRLHPPSGMDYFVFPRGMYRDIPPFAVGRAGWDNWMVYRARSQKIPVVDATAAVTAVHQNHDYGHHPQGRAGVFHGSEAERNRALLGGWQYSFCVKHADWRITRHGLRRALTAGHIYHRLDALPVLVPRLRFLGVPKRALIATSRAVRSALGLARD